MAIAAPQGQIRRGGQTSASFSVQKREVTAKIDVYQEAGAAFADCSGAVMSKGMGLRRYATKFLTSREAIEWLHKTKRTYNGVGEGWVAKRTAGEMILGEEDAG